MSRQHSETPSTHQRIRALNVMASAVADAERIDDVLALVAEETRAAIDAEELAICRYEPEHDALRVVVAVGKLPPDRERFPPAECYPLAEIPRIAARLRSGQGYCSAFDDPGLGPGEREILLGLGMESQVGAPIVVGGRLWGELWAGSLPGSPRFGSGDADMLRAVAGYVAIGVARLELVERLQALALTDSLTGLANHREFHQALERRIAQSARFTLVALDLDGFKAINDERGHAEGDRLLSAVAHVLTETLSRDERAFRVGGDEFALVLPWVDQGRTEELLALMQQRVAAAERGVWMSAGVASWPNDAVTKEPLLDRADARLYAAKRLRRPHGGEAVPCAAVTERVVKLAAEQLPTDLLAGRDLERLVQLIARELVHGGRDAAPGLGATVQHAA